PLEHRRDRRIDLTVARGRGRLRIDRHRSIVDFHLVDVADRRMLEMLDERGQVFAIAARLHVRRCRCGEADRFWAGNDTTFAVALELREELLGECLFARARASVNVASEVGAADTPIRRLTSTRRDELKRHRSSSLAAARMLSRSWSSNVLVRPSGL